MKKKMKTTFALVLVVAFGVSVQAQETIKTRVGELSFTHDFANGYALTKQVGAENGQIVLLESYEDRRTALTANNTTPYVLAFTDLTPIRRT